MRFLIKEIEAKKSDIKLSTRDRKLIQLMIQDGRITISELAKKLRVSKPAIVKKIQTLKEKEVLLETILYTSIKTEDTPFNLVQISTGLGHNTKEITSSLLEIEGILAVLWYTGPFNLLIGISHKDVHEIIDKIENIISIQKMRISKVIDNFFHPPHLFEEVKDKEINYKVVEAKVDELDKKILRVLGENPRVSILKISQKVESAPITVKKRIENMKKSGAINYISNYVNPWACGKDIVSVNFSIKGRKDLKKIISKLLSYPQTGNIWEFDHEWNLNAVLWVSNQVEVNKILEDIGKSTKGILGTEVSVLASMVGK